MTTEPPPKEDLRLEEDDLRSIIETETREAINGEDSQIAIDQERALEQYEGRPVGKLTAVEGSSAVVLRDVAQTVDWALPAMMRAIFFTQEVVRYEDATPESEAAGHGRRMTQVLNEVFRQKLRGFPVTFDWAKAGMIEGFSAIKAWAETVREPTIPQTQKLTAEQLVMLTADKQVELLEASETPDGLYEVKFKTWKTFPRVRIETLPPEEFLICRDAKRLDQDVRFVAHRKPITRSELHSFGIPWDLVADLPVAPSAIDMDGRKVSRDDDSLDFSTSTRKDKASQKVTCTESYIRVDYDGDGYSELRRVVSGGENSQQILLNDYALLHGFCGWTPIPMPHKLYGRGFAEIASDLQEIRSVLLRQLLDNIYRMNNARHVLVEGEVDLDSYLDSAVGAPIMANRADAVTPLQIPAIPSWGFEALKYLETVLEQRTGIHPYSQESYAAGQNQTAQGASQIFEAAMAQVQLLCQIFAETGLKDLFTILPRIMKQAGMGADRIKVGDSWIEYNPQDWPDEMRVSVQVGLSPGQTEQRIQRLLLLLGLQKEALASFGPGYLVSPEQIFSTAVRIVEQSGFQNPQAFFSSPEGKEMPQQPPSPDEINAQVEAKNKQAQRALDLSKLEFDRKKEEDQEARLNLIAKQEHERELARIAMEERVRMYETDRRFEAALRQAQVGLVDTGGGEGAPAGPSPSPVLSSINGRLKALETKPKTSKKVVNRNALGLIESVEEETA